MNHVVISPGPGEIGYGCKCDKRFPTQKRTDSTQRLRHYEGIVDRYVNPRFGPTPINKVSHADVVSWLSSLTHLSASSKRHVHRTLSLIMDLAVKDGRISKNPAAGVKLPKLPKTEKKFLGREQVFRLADAAGQYPTPGLGQQNRVLVSRLHSAALDGVRQLD